jgi:DnaJ-class molecular chaperone
MQEKDKEYIKFEECYHQFSWITATNPKISYCPDCDSLFSQTKCSHCKGSGYFYSKIDKKSIEK